MRMMKKKIIIFNENNFNKMSKKWRVAINAKDVIFDGASNDTQINHIVNYSKEAILQVFGQSQQVTGVMLMPGRLNESTSSEYEFWAVGTNGQPGTSNFSKFINPGNLVAPPCPPHCGAGDLVD